MRGVRDGRDDLHAQLCRGRLPPRPARHRRFQAVAAARSSAVTDYSLVDVAGVILINVTEDLVQRILLVLRAGNHGEEPLLAMLVVPPFRPPLTAPHIAHREGVGMRLLDLENEFGLELGSRTPGRCTSGATCGVPAVTKTNGSDRGHVCVVERRRGG